MLRNECIAIHYSKADRYIRYVNKVGRYSYDTGKFNSPKSRNWKKPNGTILTGNVSVILLYNEANKIMDRVIESFRRAEFTTFCLSLKSPSSSLVRWKNRWFFFGAQRKERRARRECKSSCTLGEASARDRSTVLPEFRYPRRRCRMEHSRTILRALKIP